MRNYKPSEFISAMLHSDVIKIKIDSKKCSCCKEDKDIEEFYKKSNSTDGRLEVCKKCKAAETNRRYHAKKAERDFYN